MFEHQTDGTPVYDGSVLLGHVLDRGIEFEALTADGRSLGVFPFLRGAAQVLWTSGEPHQGE